jgi:hypothetical protein
LCHTAGPAVVVGVSWKLFIATGSESKIKELPSENSQMEIILNDELLEQLEPKAQNNFKKLFSDNDVNGKV